MDGTPVSLFISYAREDAALMRQLESHLEPLRLSQLVSSWHDGCIEPGEAWAPQIKANLEAAKVILLLISVDFLRSDYCYRVELQRAIARHQARDACVIPVILRACTWKLVPVGDLQLGDLQALPKDAKPVKSWADPDEALTNVVEGILARVTQLQQAQVAAAMTAQLRELETQREQAVQAAEAEYERKKAAIQAELAALKAQQAAELEALQQELQQAEARQREAAECPPTAEVELRSAKGVDYRRLRDLLQAGQWQEADQETARRMLEAVGRDTNDWIREEELLNFPCADLKTIDALWVQYSKGKWGFSVQKQIYVACGADKLDGSYPGDAIWHEFCCRVGWRKGNRSVNYRDLTFNLEKSSAGEFPIVGLWKGVLVVVVCVGLFSRIETCKL